MKNYETFLAEKSAARESLQDFARPLRRDRSRPAVIYALVDPLTEEMRYIGKSTRPHERLVNHCNDRSSCHRTHWIQSVVAEGQRPIIHVLEVVDDGNSWQDAERGWIAYGHSQGWPLTNGTDGGDGVVNLSPESRERIRAAWVGRNHSPESRKKMSDANLGRTHTEEYKEYMRRIMTGREITPEWRAKLSRAKRKLTDEDVREIRALVASGVLRYVVAERYKVHRGTIEKIARGESYTDVLPDPTVAPAAAPHLFDGLDDDRGEAP